MAMEQLERLSHLMRVTLEPNADLIHEAKALCASIGLEALEQYYRNLIPKAEAVARIGKVAHIAYNASVLYESKVATALAHREGIDLITSGVSGLRTIQWFQQTGRAFGTDVAITAFAVAAVHEEVGMSAVYADVVTPEHVVSFVERFIDTPEAMANVFNPSLFGDIVSSEQLIQTIKNTVNTAYQELAGISPKGRMPSGTMILACGMDFLNKTNIGPLLQTFEEVFTRSPYVPREGKIFLNIGGIGGDYSILYGGPDHNVEQFRIPQIYPPGQMNFRS